MTIETFRERGLRALYSLAWYAGTPLAVAYLLWRSVRQPDYRRGWAQRFGLAYPRPARAGPLVWVHAVSVGETVAARPLVEALLAHAPERRILLTHMTPTGYETGERLFGDRVERCLLPYDMPHAVARFLRHYRPRLGVLMETELWPNLAAGAQAHGVPLALVSARLSGRSLARARRTLALVRPALARLAVVVAQTEADAARLAQLGCRASVAGNLKFDVVPDEALVARGQAWRPEGGLPVVLAASTRDGEERLVLDAWPGDAGAVLAIVPRHPQRFEEVARLMAARFGTERLVRRSASAGAFALAPEVRAVLGDSMGEMPAWYALADVAILGGSLAPFGGQNLIEACGVGVPVVLGPHTFNFAEAAEQALAAGAAVRVDDAGQAVAVALSIAGDPVRRERMSACALAFARAHRGATGRIIDALLPLLDGNPVGSPDGGGPSAAGPGR